MVGGCLLHVCVTVMININIVGVNTEHVFGRRLTSIQSRCTTVTQRQQLKAFIRKTIVHIKLPDENLPTYFNEPVRVHIQMLRCPPGFKMSQGICDCTLSIEDFATCNITKKVSREKAIVGYLQEMTQS